VSLCHFHHRRLHDGAFRVARHPGIGLAFETADGRPIIHRLPRVDPAIPRIEALRVAVGGGDESSIDADTPGTKDGSARLDLGYVVGVVLDGVQRAWAPAGS
jgi:hypothetical protein